MIESLTVVTPAYLEGETISFSIQRLLDVLEPHILRLKVVVVLDGPDPQAVDSLSHLGDRRIEVLQLATNQGKGAAIRFGISNLSSQYVAFLDADLDIHPKSLINCLSAIERSTDTSVVGAYGSKFHAQSQVAYPILRRIASRIFQYLVWILFRFDCDDTQTGVKVFRSDQVLDIMCRTVENRFLFDVEVLAALSDRGKKVISAPVILDYQYSSTINAQAGLTMVKDLLLLRMRWRKSSAVRWK